VLEEWSVTHSSFVYYIAFMEPTAKRLSIGSARNQG
jgi:hypothetical protein